MLRLSVPLISVQDLPAAIKSRSRFSSSGVQRTLGITQSFLRLQPRLAQALKGFNVSAHEKSAIVKADRDPAIVAALDNFADLTSQRHLGSPGESLSDQPDLIANFETGLQLRFWLHFALAFSPSSISRRSIISFSRDQRELRETLPDL